MLEMSSVRVVGTMSSPATQWRVLPHRDYRAHVWRQHTARDEHAVRAACGIVDYAGDGYPLIENSDAVRCLWCERAMRSAS